MQEGAGSRVPFMRICSQSWKLGTGPVVQMSSQPSDLAKKVKHEVCEEALGIGQS